MSPRPPKSLRAHGGASAVTLREHLIEAADELLGEHAPLTLSTRDIARAARVSDGVLYNHFADKEELIVAAVVRRIVRLSGRLEASIPPVGGGDLGENLLRMGRALLAVHQEALPLMAGLLSAPNLLHRVFDALHAPPAMMPAGVLRVTEYLEAERTLGRIAPDAAPGVAARLFFGAILTTALGQHIARRRDRHARADAELDLSIRTLITGFAPRAAGRDRRRPGRSRRG